MGLSHHAHSSSLVLDVSPWTSWSHIPVPPLKYLSKPINWIILASTILTVEENNLFRHISARHSPLQTTWHSALISFFTDTFENTNNHKKWHSSQKLSKVSVMHNVWDTSKWPFKILKKSWTKDLANRCFPGHDRRATYIIYIWHGLPIIFTRPPRTKVKGNGDASNCATFIFWIDEN